MGRPANRLGIPEKRPQEAHFLDPLTLAVAWHVAGWRRENPEQWVVRQQEIDPTGLRAVLGKAERMGLDPYLVAHVILGAEWLFRARPLTQADIESTLDELERRLRRSTAFGLRPWLASLLVGAMAPAALRGLKKTRVLVSLGQWAGPDYDWRDLMLARQGAKRLPSGELLDRSKSGKIPNLSPILAAIIVEGLAEHAVGPREGSQALALAVATLLRKRAIQPGEYGVWRRAVGVDAPEWTTGDDDPLPPDDLRDWLVRRWRSSYEMAYGSLLSEHKDWAGYLVALAHNPLDVFGPLANLEAISYLYTLSWFHEVSPRRPEYKKGPPRKSRPRRVAVRRRHGLA